MLFCYTFQEQHGNVDGRSVVAMRKHLRIVAWLWIFLGIASAILVLPSILVALDVITNWGDLPFGLGNLVTLGSPGKFYWSLAFSMVHVLAGINLLMRAWWARITVLIMSIVYLLVVPIGTVIGAYAIWVLFHGEIEAMFGIRQAQGRAETGRGGWTSRTHLKTVAAIHGLVGGFGTLAGSFFLLIAVAHSMRDMAPLALYVGGIWLILSLPSLLGSLNLLKWRRWARTLILIVSGPLLLAFPAGTLIGAYAIWVLNRGDVRQLFDHPPPPASEPPILVDDPGRAFRTQGS